MCEKQRKLFLLLKVMGFCSPFISSKNVVCECATWTWKQFNYKCIISHNGNNKKEIEIKER